MIVFRCANGIALFRVGLIKQSNTMGWRCLNDGTTNQNDRTDAGLEQFLLSMAQKATQLKGAVQQIVDIAEVV